MGLLRFYKALTYLALQNHVCILLSSQNSQLNACFFQPPSLHHFKSVGSLWPQICFYVDKAKVILHYPPIINILQLDKIIPHHNTALAFALFLYPLSSILMYHSKIQTTHYYQLFVIGVHSEPIHYLSPFVSILHFRSTYSSCRATLQKSLLYIRTERREEEKKRQRLILNN